MEDQLRHPKEKTYFLYCVIFSALVYLVLAVTIIGAVYVAFAALAVWLAHGMLVGGLKGNAVRVGPTQFPELDALVQRLSLDLGLPSAPTVYVQQSGGVLNAFASRFLGRNFVVLYSDVVELALLEGKDALAFVVGHELGHLKMRHVQRRAWVYPAMLLPFLGTAYSRACEYSADRCGRHVGGPDSVAGLLVLASGKRLFRSMDLQAFAAQANEPLGFFGWLSEKTSTHPNLTKRVKEAVSGF